MLDFGTSASHSNAVQFPDRDILDAMPGYTICLTLQARAGPWTTLRGILSKFSSNAGWTLRTVQSGGSNFLRMLHGSSGTSSNPGDSTTPLVAGTTYRFILTWDEATFTYYLNGVSDGGGAFTKAIEANAFPISLGNENALGIGAQVAIGNVCIFPGYVFSAGEIAQWDAGAQMAAAAQLELWHKGLEVPGVDRVRGVNGVLVGTVVTLADPTDAFFPDSRTVPQWRRLATQRLLRRRTEEPIFSLRVPDHYLSIPVGGLFQLSHEGIPLSASRLAGASIGTPLPQLLASQPWRRSSVFLLGHTDHPLEHTVDLRFADHEGFGATYWSTDRLPEGTNDAYAGLGRLDVGAIHTVTRSSKALLEQENDVLEEPAFQAEGQFFRAVGAFAEKMNHRGFLAEDATDNPVLNSHAKLGETSWTSVDNSGTTDLSTLRLAYPLAITTNSWRFVRANNSANTYREQLFAVLTADAFRRVYIVKTEQNATSIVSWQLQRSTDSWYWNDSTGAWQSGAVWNQLANTYDAAIARPRFARAISKPVSIDDDENWTIRYGLEGAALPAGGGEVNVYSVEALKGKLRFSSVPTEGAAVSTAADIVAVERTALPQIAPATRYSATCRMRAIQDGADLVDGDKLCLWYQQWGTTDADDFDVLIYEKPAGASPRFSFERYIGGVFDVRATFTVTIVPGTEYSIACIATADAGEDLAVSDSTLRIVVDGAQGVDGVASANHSPAEVHSELWKGSAPAGAALRRGMNYTWNHRVWPRCLTNEEAAGA
jgi:hypothetical protein